MSRYSLYPLLTCHFVSSCMSAFSLQFNFRDANVPVSPSFAPPRPLPPARVQVMMHVASFASHPPRLVRRRQRDINGWASSSRSLDGVASFINVGAATPAPTGDIYSWTALLVWSTPATEPPAHPLSSYPSFFSSPLSSSPSSPPRPVHVLFFPILLLSFDLLFLLLSFCSSPVNLLHVLTQRLLNCGRESLMGPSCNM